MTFNHQFVTLRQKMKEKKYVLINSFCLLATICILILFANRATFDFLLGNHFQGLWLYHSSLFFYTILVIIALTFILIYGLFIDPLAFDKKLKIYSASYWKETIREIIQVRREILIAGIKVILFLGLQATITFTIATITSFDFIGVMCYQVLISLLIFNISPIRTFSKDRSVPVTSINLANLIYLFILIFAAIKLYT